MKDNKVLLSIKNASYQYNDAEEGEYALRDVSFDFEKGKVYAIRGRSGTGKTTLLSLISGLERYTEGDIVFNGKNLERLISIIIVVMISASFSKATIYCLL